MKVQILRDSCVNRVQELAKLNGAEMPSMALSITFPVFTLRAAKSEVVPWRRVIMRPPLDLARPHGQKRLGSVERLNLGLLVYAQHQSSIRRIQIQPNDITNFFNKQRVFRQLKCLRTMGLQSKSPPDTANGALTQPTFPGHGAGAPMRRILRGRLQRSGNHTLHVGIHNLPGSTGARLSSRPSRRWAMNRARHFPTVWGAIWRTAATDRLDFPVAHPSTIRARLCQCLSCFTTVHPTFQGFSFFGCQMEWRKWTPFSHGHSPFSTHYTHCL